MTATNRAFRLTEDADSVGLRCAHDGLWFAGAPLLNKTPEGFAPRSIKEIDVLLKAAYGELVDANSVARGLGVVAHALDQGDLGRAMIASLRLDLSEPDAAAVARIAEAEAILAKYNPEVLAELRNESGEWTSGGSGGRKPSPARVATNHGKPGQGRARQAPDRSVDVLHLEGIPRSGLSGAQQKAVSAFAAETLDGSPDKRFTWLATESALGLGSNSDPGPGRLIEEWRTGSGPQTRILDASSAFSRQFAIASSTQEIVGKAISLWSHRRGGFAGPDGDYQFTKFRGVFGPKQFAEDTLSPNAAAHVIGSFALAGILDGDMIHWQAVNNMSLGSFSAEHWTEKFHLPEILPDVDRPLRFGTTRQVIRWDTTESGRYIDRSRTSK